jgi:hypothetical protein
MKSPAYWNAAFYDFFLKYVWRRSEFIEVQHWKAVVQWIPEGAYVVDVAAGTGRFYRDVLAGHISVYVALDINAAFIEYMKRQDIDARFSDIRKDPIPPGDIVVILSALYHFKGMESDILKKLLNAARQRLIIVEPLGSDMVLSSWRNRLRATLVDIGEGPIYDRYTAEELYILCAANGYVEYAGPLPGNAFLCVMHGQYSASPS